MLVGVVIAGIGLFSFLSARKKLREIDLPNSGFPVQVKAYMSLSGSTETADHLSRTNSTGQIVLDRIGVTFFRLRMIYQTGLVTFVLGVVQFIMFVLSGFFFKPASFAQFSAMDFVNLYFKLEGVGVRLISGIHVTPPSSDPQLWDVAVSIMAWPLLALQVVIGGLVLIWIAFAALKPQS